MMTEKAQRLVFGETLVELGEENERLVVLDADVSCSTQTRLFGERFPERFFNMGICEAGMISTAAGLAACGYIPVVSTFALFIALRAADPVRSQVAGPNLNVKLVGGYAGLSDFADGASHQSVEDLAVMRAIPNMTVISPSDITTTRLALRAMVNHQGPVFLRISREKVRESYPHDHPFEIGKATTVHEGRDLTIVTTGTLLPIAGTAVNLLRQKGVSARLIDMHTIKPLDVQCVERAARETGAVVTVEEHNVIGGLGSAVGEAVCERCPVPVVRVGIPDRFGETGAYPAILERAGLTAANIVTGAGRAIAAKKSTVACIH